MWFHGSLLIYRSLVPQVDPNMSSGHPHPHYWWTLCVCFIFNWRTKMLNCSRSVVQELAFLSPQKSMFCTQTICIVSPQMEPTLLNPTKSPPPSSAKVPGSTYADNILSWHSLYCIVCSFNFFQLIFLYFYVHFNLTTNNFNWIKISLILEILHGLHFWEDVLKSMCYSKEYR